MYVILTLTVYIAGTNILGFLLMGIDKYKAKKGTFRIPESTLFTVAIIGGSLGSLIGMHLFRHKTRHLTFVYGMPAILILHLALYFFITHSGVTFEVL